MTKRRLAAFSLVIALSIFSGALLSSRAQAQQTDRAKQIGGKFMCMCSCNQVLTQCNHVGCTVSASMLKELDAWVARGDSETAVTSAFVQEFGTKVYAEPPKSGLSLVAWSLPSIYLLLGTLLVIVVIWRWRSRPMPPEAVGGAPGISPQDLERARRRVAQETED
ncbi:MAG TPA: cytochrome c-type biogenesis protein CcmH [Candidatus Acidoferrum sp.]|nr:cytochrome c-type biogenesis protein CcmH [Candidatus Acidoferrum sp.]